MCEAHASLDTNTMEHCVDDPHGILQALGLSCSQVLLSLACDRQLSALYYYGYSPYLPFYYSFYYVAPPSPPDSPPPDRKLGDKKSNGIDPAEGNLDYNPATTTVREVCPCHCPSVSSVFPVRVGGALYLHQSVSVLRRVGILNNSADTGGGAFVVGG